MRIDNSRCLTAKVKVFSRVAKNLIRWFDLGVDNETPARLSRQLGIGNVSLGVGRFISYGSVSCLYEMQSLHKTSKDDPEEWFGAGFALNPVREQACILKY